MADSAPEAAATEQLPFSVQHQAVCVAVVFASDVDSTAVQTWFSTSQPGMLPLLDVAACQAALDSSSILAQELAAAKEASTSAGTEFALSASLKARLLQHRIDADVAAAAAAELARRKAALEEADARLMAAVEGLGMARDDFGTATGAPLSDEAHFSSVAEAGCPDDEAAAVAYRAWEAAETKQAEAYAAREAAEAALEADYVHAQLYRCEGLGASAAALAEVHAAGLPLKAVVHVHKATEPQLLAPDGSGGPPLPDLIAELLEQQQVASTTSATAAVAVVDIAIGQLGSRFARTHEEGEAPTGAVELRKALAALTVQATAYDSWRRSAAVYDLGENPAPADVAQLTQQLNELPQELCSVPVVLQAMVDQVGRNLADPNLIQQLDQAELQARAEAALNSALCSVSLGGSELAVNARGELASQNGLGFVPGGVSASVQQPRQPCVLHEGSYAGASSLAVATGFVNIDCPARSALAHIDAAQAQTHLQELAPMPGSSGRGLPETPALSEAARGAMTSALEGHCGPANVRVECAERYAMLRAFGETLPEGVRDTHTADIVKRHHCEDLDAGQMREAIGKAQASLPEVSTSYYAPQDVLLVACHAGITQLPAGAKLPRLVSFAEYWEAFVKSGGSPPQLESRVYSLPKELADKADNIKLMYPEDGSIISTGPSSRLCVQRSSTTLSLAIEHGQPRVLATLDNGSTLLGRLRAAAGDDLATEPTLGLQCVAPTGSTVELTTSGEVLTTLPGKKPREMPPTLGVAVLGAPLEGGNVDALLADQEHAWRAVLPTGAVVTAYRSGRTRVLHPTGEVSEHTSPAATAPDMAGQSVAHWVRTNMEGAKWQTPEAEEQQSTSADALPAAAGTDTASAVPPTTAPSTDPKLATDATATSNATEPAAVGPGPAPGSAHAAESATVESVGSVTVTDPDIGAKVTTRGDLVMVIDYVNGDRLVQDADGTRLTITADGAWCVEMAGVHPIRGEAAGLTVTPVPGVSMRWTAETAAITVGLPDGCLLIGSHSVVAMLPPTVPDAATPEWIVETVTSAAGHASAERQRQIKEYQEALAAKKESDRLAVEQAIAEQQVAAEAAAEAEKKKGAKKPSAKDKAEAEAAAAAAAAALEALKEQAAMVPPPPVFVQDPSGVADLVASACTGWYVFDLDVGAVSLAQADQTQVTVNSEGKVSGWPRDSPRASGEPGTPSTAAAGARVMNRSLTQAERSLRRRAPHVKPRLFVVSRSGGGYEVLDEGVFEAYRQRKAADERCNLQIQDVLGTAEPGTRAYSFLTKHTLATREVPELRIAVGATAWPATPALALPALSKPSKVLPAPPAQGFVLPRVAAYTPVAPRPPAPEPIYTFRHIMEYPALTNSDVVTLQQILQAQAAWQVHQASIGPESYMLPDTRSPEEVQQAAELAARLAAARAQRAQQQADAAQQQAAQQAQQEQEAAERLAAEQHRVGTGGAASGTSERGDAEQKPVKAKSPWPPKVVPYEDTPQRPAAGTPLPYWAAEEGLKVVEAQALAGSPQRSPARRGAPPRPMAGVYLGDSADELQEPNPPKGQQRHGQLPSLNASPRSAKLGATPANTMVPGAGGGSVRQLHPGMAEPGANPMQVSSTTGTQRGKLLDIYGKPRVAAPRMPAAYFPEEATPEVNHRYLDINEDAMRLTRTASANMIRLRGKATRQFQLTPSHLHFGTLPLGTVAHQTAHLLNVSPERARYNVLRPVLPLKVIHKMGPIAAGMEAAITVEFVPQQIGDFVGEIHINSEINTFVLTVSAKVVEAIAPQPSLATFIMPEKAAVNSVADPTVLGAEDGKSQQGDLSRRTSVPSDPAALASRSASIQSVTATVLPPMQ